MNATFNTTSFFDTGEDIELIFASLFYIVLAITIVVGNMLVITAFITDRRLRTTTNKFLVGLAVSDLLVGFISVPIWVYFSIVQLNGRFIATDISLDIFFSTMDVFSSCASVLQLTAIGVERYFAITQPINHRACSRQVYNITVLLIWVYSIAIAGLFPAQRIILTWQKEYTLIVFTTCFALPSIILSFVYAKILRAARVATSRNRVTPAMQSDGGTRIQKERRIAITIALITLLFLFSWLPFYVVTMIASFCGMKCLPHSVLGITRLIRFVKWMHFCNSAVNPFVYAYRNVVMRRAFARIIKAANVCGFVRQRFRASQIIRNPVKKVESLIRCHPEQDNGKEQRQQQQQQQQQQQ